MQTQIQPHTASLAALCGMVSFLKESLLDMSVLPLGQMESLPALGGEQTEGGSRDPQYLLLNGAALESLEILENNEGGSVGAREGYSRDTQVFIFSRVVGLGFFGAGWIIVWV